MGTRVDLSVFCAVVIYQTLCTDGYFELSTALVTFHLYKTSLTSFWLLSQCTWCTCIWQLTNWKFTVSHGCIMWLYYVTVLLDRSTWSYDMTAVSLNWVTCQLALECWLWWHVAECCGPRFEGPEVVRWCGGNIHALGHTPHHAPPSQSARREEAGWVLMTDSSFTYTETPLQQWLANFACMFVALAVLLWQTKNRLELALQ